MERLVLHIGHPKTGTTSLQSTFRDSSAALARHGVFYFAGFRNNHPIGRSMHAKTRNANDEAIAAQFFKEAKATRCPQGLVSSENFTKLKGEEPQACLEKLRAVADRVDVLIYVRHPIGYCNGSAHQSVRSGRPLGEVSQDPRVLNLTSLLQRWEEAAGEEHMIVKAFHRPSLVNGDVVDDVLSVLGAQAAAPHLTRATINDGLSALGIELLDRAHRQCGEAAMLRLGAVRAFDAIAGPRYVLPPEARAKVLADAAPHMAYLKDKYGIELPDPPDPGPAPALPSEETLDSMAEVISQLVQYAYKCDSSDLGQLLGMRSPYTAEVDMPPHRLRKRLERLKLVRPPRPFDRKTARRKPVRPRKAGAPGADQ
ncbi:MAG: hypothetical protein ROR55_08035 [Devosia sp.]